MENTGSEPAGLDALPSVAREAIRARLEKRGAVSPVDAEGALARQAPVFVTVRIAGELRGCMGDLEARHADLVAETMDHALAAAFRDPRFPPLKRAELDQATIDVTILEPLEPVESIDELDPAVYGIEITDAGGRRAVLLPAIEGVDTVEMQLLLARRKAGIPEDAKVTIRRFRASKVSE